MMGKSNDNMQYCYMFLECNPNDTETKIRENFLYKLNEAYSEYNGCLTFFTQYSDYAGTADERFMQQKEAALIRNDVELLCDSYLAIVLSRKDAGLYGNIINGLIKRWDEEKYRFWSDDNDYNHYFALRFPTENENIEMLEPTYITKEEYLNQLTIWYEQASHHRFCCSPSLAIAINFEKEMMDEYKCLKKYRKKHMPLGRIVKNNEHNIKLERVKKYTTEIQKERCNHCK